MNLRWLWLNHFPPDLELTDVERAKAKRIAAAHWKREPDFRGGRRRYFQTMIPVIVIAFAAPTRQRGTRVCLAGASAWSRDEMK